MQSNWITSRPVLVAATAIVAGLAFRIRVTLMPVETLASRYLADDYFYYLNIARHLADGHGSSFDGGVTFTNGYQPLFVAMLVAVFKMGASKSAAVHLGLLIQAVAAAGAAVLAWKIGASRGQPWAGALAAGLISLNLFFVLPTLTGFEMALSLAAVLAAVWSWDREHPPFAVGLLCGLAVLARIDSAVLVAAFCLGMLVRRRTRDAAVLLGGLLVVAGPWILWNWLSFGHPLPDSGVIKAHYRGIEGVRAGAWTAFTALPRIVVPGFVVDRLSAHAGWLVSVISALVLGLTVRGALRVEFRVLVLYAIGITAAYIMLIDAREGGALVRYLFPVWAIVALLLASGIRGRAGAIAVVLVIGLQAAEALRYVRWEATAPLPATYVGAAVVHGGPEIDRLVPAEERVGSFDAGALGYFSSRTVVNLDGLVNHDIVELRRTCSGPYAECLLTYIRSKGITAIAGGTSFSWVNHFPGWRQWDRLYESPRLVDGARLVIVRVPPR